jgi:hypothetical protein
MILVEMERKGVWLISMRNHKKKTWPLNLSLRFSKVVWVIVGIHVSRPAPRFPIVIAPCAMDELMMPK